MKLFLKRNLVIRLTQWHMQEQGKVHDDYVHLVFIWYESAAYAVRISERRRFIPYYSLLWTTNPSGWIQITSRNIDDDMMISVVLTLNGGVFEDYFFLYILLLLEIHF